MRFLSGLFGRKADEPNQLQPQPLSINPSSPAQLKRHIGRLATLYAAQARDPDRQDVRQEIAQRCQAIRAFGHASPQSEGEARDLLQRLGGK